MRQLAFRILNVFTIAEQRLSGNPLAVFEDGSGLSDAEMMALARQFNLSETTFILPADNADATARVRIFTPSYEMPFAGHPTLGTAHVVRQLRDARDRVTLEMKVGLVDVIARGDTWTLRTAKAPVVRKPTASKAELAAMLGLDADAVSEEPLWVDTGSEQLVIPLRSAEDVAACRPNAEALGRLGYNEKRGSSMAYVWAPSEGRTLEARFFFLLGGNLVEDPATGSACANLGGYLIEQAATLPIGLTVQQGSAIGRPSQLRLRVDEHRNVFVGGEVVELGRGTLRI
ncbi:MAG: PhzF family phenazine biosynthesis protein [Polyangiaceae bacterium]|nr:PhzF family phenazine biosynthesis protein [Polyangiaceae bacterium]